MGIAISPDHVVAEGFPPSTEWPLDFKIEVFLSRVDRWHLEVADRVVNGWVNADGAQCINAPHWSGNMSNIPDSGWAVLQIVLNYFEIVGLFKRFSKANVGDYGTLFSEGFCDVFPEYENHEPNIATILFGDLRAGLYHSGVRSGKIFLRHGEPFAPLRWDTQNKRLVVDPHLLVRHLRSHLNDYGKRLRDPTEKDLRAKFEAAYYVYYES